MAVVTEPPWVNQASGIADRNGTTSHTISFGFTSTAGNELVVVVYGSVTHTVAGWTEQLQPINGGELSVFTKTSAGDSSITVIHNGSNYPVAWAAYELPAGSTWVGGVGSNPSTDTFPALTGLPGTEVVVLAARGRSAFTTLSTSAASTVTAPWVEDADLFVADDEVTDGCYLFVTHQINVTATSVTPIAATTYGGTWGSADRQHVTFALNVAASGGGTTVVTKAVASTWTVAATVTKTVASTWNTAATVSKAVAATWGTAAQVTKPVATSWNVAATVSKAVATSWNVAGVVTKSVATTWDVDAAGQVAKSVATSWDVAAVTSKAVAASWNVSTSVTKSVGTSWDTAARVAASMATTWAVDASPTAGVVVRPFTGVVVRPYTGTVTRP